MMGNRSCTTTMLHAFCIDEMVPENHLLRLVDRYVDFGFIRERLRPFYSDVGRPSVDPEVLLRILLIGYLYGIKSERRLIEEITMHLAYRWFTGLGFDQAIPDHSTFSKNRHGRFTESSIFREIFEDIVQRCIDAGMVKGERFSVDGTIIAANASGKSRIPREQLAEAAVVSRTVQEYLEELDAAPEPEPARPASGIPHARQDADGKVSTTDPDAAWAAKGGPVHLSYYNNYLIDNASNVILDVEMTPARNAQEIIAAQRMLDRTRSTFNLQPVCLAADTGYGTGEFFSWLSERGITPHIPVLDRTHQTGGKFTRKEFIFDADLNAYRCPAGKFLKYRGIGRTTRVHLYRAKTRDCRNCNLKERCTSSTVRRIARSFDEPIRERMRELAKTDDYKQSRRERRKVETLFSELKNIVNLSRVRLRRLKHVGEQALMAATAQNIKRLARFLRRREAFAAG